MEDHSMSKTKLTKYTPGGIKELLAISWPIMLSCAAGGSMIVIDRIILSRYSVEAFNACFGVIQWYWAFFFTALEFVLISEVFVGQYNGARRYEEIGPVVWQMIWFCLGMLIFYIPLAFFVAPYLVADNIAFLGLPYLKIILLFIPINCIGMGALTAFFIGRGKTKIIPVIAVISNILNIVLDYCFIFGIRVNGVQLIPEGGIIGAAIATVISQTVPLFLLFALFLSKSNRERFNTSRMEFRLDLLTSCLKVGGPSTVARFINSALWAVMTQIIVTHVTTDDFQGYGIVHSIYLLFFFIIKGISAGTRTICANAIGAEEWEVIHKNMHSWLVLGWIVFIVATVGMLGFPDELIRIFLDETENSNASNLAQWMLIWAWWVFILDYVVNNLVSILLAAGDTTFTMLVHTICFILCAIVPTYVGLVYYGKTSIIFWQFMLLDSVVRILFFVYRYRSGRWMKNKLV
jgi:MATE family multidrug resistance protein